MLVEEPVTPAVPMLTALVTPLDVAPVPRPMEEAAVAIPTLTIAPEKVVL